MRPFAVGLLCLATLFIPGQVLALSIERIGGAAWQAEKLELQLALEESDASGRIQLANLTLPAPFGEITDLQFDCPVLIFTPQRIACLDAPLKARWALLDKPPAQASIEYLAQTGELRLNLKALAALGGEMSVALKLQAAGWQAEGQLDKLAAARLAPLLKTTGQDISADAGLVSGDFKINGDDGGQQAHFKLALNGVTANNAAGDLASDGLSVSLQGELRGNADRWQGKAQLNASAGQVYVNPVFMDVGEYPLQLSTQLAYTVAGQQLRLTDLQMTQKAVANLMAEATLALQAETILQDLQLSLEDIDLAGAYPVYLQPFLLDYGLDELQTLGNIRGRVALTSGAPQQLQLELSEVTAHDANERFSVDQLNGQLFWDARDNPPQSQRQDSQLSWAGGSAYKLPFEAGELKVRANSNNLQLLEPLRLALLGGALRIEKLIARGLGTEQLALQFDGGLEPLRLTDLTRALGWPEFAGTLSGRLPDLNYQQGNLSVGGTLAAEVFDGTVAVEGLRVADPFGRLPRLEADLRMRNLDLAAATSAFQFGAIEGRLHADVEGLRLLNWQPVAFDARFYTPEDDRSRHRISQRAIENISSLGGAGAGAALSRGFMRFFENFAYDRLGLSCRLANGVCRMGGIEDAADKGGYYLVKGKLLPRIDVIGYADEVSWPALIEQLKSIGEGDGPEVR